MESSEKPELTLGQLRNRIDSLLTAKVYRPDMPASTVLNEEVYRGFLHKDKGDGVGRKGRG